MGRRQPAAEQAAHPMSGPRRRPHKLSGSFVAQGDSERTTHVNCSPIFPARFTTAKAMDIDDVLTARLGRMHSSSDLLDPLVVSVSIT
jgi:hypothetical protein